MKEKLKQLDTTKGWLWCAIILSFLINIMFIGKSYMIYLSTDEQAPFAVAAYLNGVDWSPTTRNLAYYSYGYSFILAPIFWLTNSAKALYRGAIVVNALMASAIVPLAWSIGKKINRQISDKLLIGIAFCVAHYSCIIVRAHLALYEMTLITLMWVLTWLYFSMEEKPKVWKYILFGVLLVYGYMVHQRMLGVVLAGCLTLAVHFVRNLKEKKDRKLLIWLIAAAAAIAVVFMVHGELKVNFKAALWQGSATGNGNDFESLDGRFDKYLTRQGFNDLIKECFGQMYYMGVATFLFGFVGAFYLLKTNLQTLAALFSRKKKMPEYAMGHLFILLAFGASFGISVMFMAGGTHRADFLVYGRYIEMTFGPILLIGLISLLSKEQKPGIFSLLSVGALVVCTLITDYAYGNVRYVEFADISCIGISIFHHDGAVHVYEGMLWAIGIFTVAFLLLRKRTEKIQIITLALIAAGWTYIGGNLMVEKVLSAQNATYEYNRLLEAREEGTEDWPIYYTGPSGATYEAPFIQYLMKDQVLHYLDISELYTLEGDYYVINKHSPVEMQEGYTLLGSAHGVFIYKHDDRVRDDVIELPLNVFSTMAGVLTSEGLVNSTEGILMYGPYLTLIAGTYEVEIQYEMLSEGGDGYFAVTSGETTHAVSRFAENTCDQNGVYTAKMKFCLIETWEREEIICNIKAGQLRILDVKFSWCDDMIDLPLSMFATELAVEDDNGVVNSAPGRLFTGPDSTWYKGKYEIQVEYEVLTEDFSGTIAICTGDTPLDELVLDAQSSQAVLHVSVGDEPTEYIRLNCDIDSGQIRITNVTILREMEE